MPVAGDHPRSRGVYRLARPPCGRARGSSPLARGLRHGVLPGSGPPGIIPARAGFTRPKPASSPPPPDHPRSRGVYVIKAFADSGWLGSSPLARGLRQVVDGLPVVGGIIPARAGFTKARGRPPLTSGIIPARAGFTRGCRERQPGQWDHPRSRGVYALEERCLNNPGGSSPLARGLLSWFQSYVQPVRIIPARAGFTSSPAPGPPSSADHPRSRGVYPQNFSAGSFFGGSSPLARGLQVRLVEAGGVERIIPARAGFTVGCHQSESVTGGSSPLARGLPLHALKIIGVDGIIPARAGFTQEAGRILARHQDHPRSRGVYTTEDAVAEADRGSSPLARGLPRPVPDRRVRLRIIPARAGFTTASTTTMRPSPDHPRSRGVYAYASGARCP